MPNLSSLSGDVDGTLNSITLLDENTMNDFDDIVNSDAITMNANDMTQDVS